MEKNNGKIYILIGPSAGGKTTLHKALTEGCYTSSSVEKLSLSDCCSKTARNIRRVITSTTRSPRESERDGVDYRFLSPEEFEGQKKRGNIIGETVYAGNSYGILASDINSIFSDGVNGLMVLDKYGVMELKEIYGEERIIGIFIYRELESIERELRKRSGNQEEISARLKIAVEELKIKDDFDYIIYNTGEIEEAILELCNIIEGN